MAIELTLDQKVVDKREPRAAKSVGHKATSSKDRMFFTEQLALLVETGMPVHQALKVLREQVSSAELAHVIDDLHQQLSGGQTLSHAMEQHPKVFSSTYVNLVAASEGGGFMHEVLTQLLSMEEKREELRSTLISAFTYPAFLVGFSILVVIFVLAFVFPKFGTLFLAIKDELPITTVVLLALSDLLTQHWMPLLGALAALVFLTSRQLRTEAGRRFIDRRKLYNPLICGIFRRLYLVQALRVLSLSLANGVTVVDALRACRDVVDNRVFQAMVKRVEEIVLQGGKVAEGFAESPFVPDLAKQMIATAEEAGNLALVADRMAKFYQGELNKALERLSKIIEPVMLLVMGVVVGVIVSSLILPIFKLSHAVG